jgi:uncharacterized LabA/DUF88 family protein
MESQGTQDRRAQTAGPVFAFIDSQNLNLGVSHNISHGDHTIYSGWQLDFAKFRRYLKDKHKVDTAFCFLGNISGNEHLYEYLQRAGYIVVLKPTTTYEDHGVQKVKGNVDTDLVLYAAAKEFHNYSKAVVVSGDGDFLSLYDYLAKYDKLGRIVIPNKRNFSQLLTKYADYFDFVSLNRKKLERTYKPYSAPGPSSD